MPDVLFVVEETLRLCEKCLNCGLRIPITATFCSRECYKDYHFKLKNRTKEISVGRKEYMIVYNMRYEEIILSNDKLGS